MTRCYYDSAATPSVSPAFHSSWEITGEAVRRVLNLSKGSSALSTLTVNEDAAVTANHQGILVAQFVSPPLAAGTLSGTFKGQIRAAESNAAANYHSECVVRIVSKDGATFRSPDGYSGTGSTETGNPANEWVLALTNRQMPRGGSVSLGSVTIQNEDRAVVEIGLRGHNIQATARTGSLRIGENSGSDLPEDETDTNDFAPWLDFSATLALYVPPKAMFLPRRTKTRLRR